MANHYRLAVIIEDTAVVLELKGREQKFEIIESKPRCGPA